MFIILKANDFVIWYATRNSNLFFLTFLLIPHLTIIIVDALISIK